MPYLGRITDTGLYTAVGFSGHGFQLAPAVGEAMAALVTGGDPADLLDGLHPDRTQLNPVAAAWRNAG